MAGKKYIERIIDTAVGDMRENIQAMTESMQSLQTGIETEVEILKNLLNVTGATVSSDTFTGASFSNCTSNIAVGGTIPSTATPVANIIPVKGSGLIFIHPTTGVIKNATNGPAPIYSVFQTVEEVTSGAFVFNLYSTSAADDPDVATLSVTIDGETLFSESSTSRKAQAETPIAISAVIPSKFLDGKPHICITSYNAYVDWSETPIVNFTGGEILYLNWWRRYSGSVAPEGYNGIGRITSGAIKLHGNATSGKWCYQSYIAKPDSASQLVSLVYGGNKADQAITRLFNIDGTEIGTAQVGRIVDLSRVMYANGYGIEITMPSDGTITSIAVRYIA